MKKILSVLLSLVMILSLLPTTTMASDVITKVELNIRKSVAGEPWRWHKTATTVNKDSNYTVYQNAEWYDETEKPTQTEKPEETDKPVEKPTQTEKPQETPMMSFVDVVKGQYYYDAVMWAAENGITGGTSATTFSPEDSCTRGQVVTFLYRFINGQ